MYEITIITSFFNADKYITHYLNNVKNIVGYKEICLHYAYNIVGSHNNNSEISTILNNFSLLYPNFKVININKEDDKGLYHLWNMAVKTTKTPYMMTLNIDDMCYPNYIINGLKYMKFGGDKVAIVSCPVNITKIPNSNNYYTTWYKTKKIYYDKRFNLLAQLKKANVVYKNGRYIELKCNRNYKKISYKIPSHFKKSVKVEYNEYCLEDMFVDWNNNNNYNSYCMPHCCPIWRSDLHSKYGQFNYEKYGVYADFEFWLRIMKDNNKCFLMKNAEVLYLEDENSLERRSSNKDVYMNLIINEYLI